MNPPFPAPLLRMIAASPFLLAASGALAQQESAPRCHYNNIVTLPLKYSGPSLDLTTEGTINRRPASFLVSTGSQDILLTRSGATRHGLDWRATAGTALGVGGHARIYRTRLAEFTVGPGRAQDVYMKILGDFGSPAHYDGIAGAHFLFQSDLEFDLSGKKIRFFRQQHCKDTFLAYWDPNAYVLPYEQAYADHRNPQFTVMLNGVKLRASISSGAAATSVTLDAARRAGLKLDDAGVERAGAIGGTGADKVERWTASFDTLEIGAETIRNARIGIVDTDDLKVDLLLCADFLRTHRVLFARSQQRLYISYLGGEPFQQTRRLEPWIQKEADEGNTHAQMMLAAMYHSGRGAERDAVKARTWLDKAAAGGNPRANILVADSLMQQGQHAEAAKRLRRALDAAPGSRHAALALYAARMHTGLPELAKLELEEAFARDDDEWPGPVAQYYLGKIKEEELLEQARDDSKRAKANTCLAWRHIGERHAFEGNDKAARAAREQWQAHCGGESST